VDSNNIRWVIEGFGSFKSAREDTIFPALLKNGNEILSAPLVKIFTAFLVLRYIRGGVAKGEGYLYSKARAHIVCNG
jgi:hypothetical protein